MGATLSTDSARKILEYVHQYAQDPKGNIEGLYIIYAIDKTFVFIGESHGPQELQNVPFVRFMADVCGDYPIDFFIESNIEWRDTLRHRTKT